MGSLPHLSVLKGPTRLLKPNYIHKLFEKYVENENHCDNIALLFENVLGTTKYTYAELNAKSNKIARHIQQDVINNKLSSNNDGDYIVAVSMHPSDKLVITLLGIWKAGAAYLPLDPTFPGPRIEHIVRESKPFMIIYEEGN